MPLGPINYATGADSPLQALNAGFQSGAVQQATQMQLQQQQIQLQQQQSAQADARDMGANPTLQNIASFALKHPQLGEQVKAGFEMQSSAIQQSRLQAAIPTYTAVMKDQPDIAVKYFNDAANGAEASGGVEQARFLRANAAMVKSNPQLAKSVLGLQLAYAMGPDAFAKIGTEFRAQNAEPLQLTKLGGEAKQAAAIGDNAPIVQGAAAGGAVSDANIKAVQAANAAPMAQADLAAKVQTTQASKDAAALAKDKLKTDTQLAMYTIGLKYGAPQGENLKLVNDSIKNSVSSNTMADRFATFADKYENVANSIAGVPGNKAFKVIQDKFGFEPDLINIRNEYNRMKAQGILASMPPGLNRITNKDLSVFGGGQPKDTDPPSVVVPYLRSVATVERLNGVTEDAKGQWAAANRSLGPAIKPLNVNGVSVAAGTPFQDFLKKYQTVKMNEYQQQQNAATVQNSPYAPYLQSPTGGQ